MAKNSFGKSLVSGILILTVSIAMLIGTTYAVFNDNASTNVNTIQAGTLDVDLVDAQGNSLEGETVSFTGGSDLRWEPDGEYTLETVYIKNKGDLDIKYKIEVNGINGSGDLDSVLEWAVKVNGNNEDLDDYEATLEAGSDPVPVVLVGKMSHNADNEMMGKTASAISITVRAKQTTEEAEY